MPSFRDCGVAILSSACFLVDVGYIFFIFETANICTFYPLQDVVGNYLEGVLGTPGYIPPEMYLGLSHGALGHKDVWVGGWVDGRVGCQVDNFLEDTELPISDNILLPFLSLSLSVFLTRTSAMS